MPSKASQNSPNQKLAGVLPPAPLPGLFTEPTGGFLTFGRIFSPSIILKSPPIKICCENTGCLASCSEMPGYGKNLCHTITDHSSRTSCWLMKWSKNKKYWKFVSCCIEYGAMQKNGKKTMFPFFHDIEWKFSFLYLRGDFW